MAGSTQTAALDKLIQESEDAIRRLEDIQKRKSAQSTPILRRISQHFHKNSPHLLNVLLAGSVLVVALGRLGQKHEYQAQREAWEEEQRRLQADKQRAEAAAAALASSTEALAEKLQAAVQRGGRDLPNAVLQHVAAWRQQLAEQPPSPVDAAPASYAAGGAAAASSGQSGGIMF